MAELLALGFSCLEPVAGSVSPLGDEAAEGLIGGLVHEGPATEAALLSTSWGTEIYMVSEDSTTAEAMALAEISDLGGVRPDCLLQSLYAFHQDEVPGHLLEVVTGLGAVATVEPVGTEGIERARMLADRAGSSGPMLDRLFAEASAVAGNILGRVELDTEEMSQADLDSAARIAERLLTEEVERFMATMSGVVALDPSCLDSSPMVESPGAEVIEFRRPGTAG